MAEIHTLYKDGKSIYPITHISAVVDDNGNTITEILPTKVSQLENDSGYITEIPDTIASKEYVESAILNIEANKQNTLISGTNIKTINGESILGEGNLDISSGGDIYYLELPVDENGQCLSEGSLTQEQFENISKCSVLKVRTYNQSVETSTILTDIVFDYKLSQIEQYEDNTFAAYAYSNLYTNLTENCFNLYILTIQPISESEYAYTLLKKRIFMDSEITDPSDVYLSTNSVYELNISANTKYGEISEEEFNRIVASKSLILDTGMHKILCIQRTAPEAYPDTYYFYGNFFEDVEQKIILSLIRNDGGCVYRIQTEELNSVSSESVPIVNSESSLDPNAKAGSLAVVSKEEVRSFGEIETYVDISNPDGSISNTTELTKIQSLDFQNTIALPNDITVTVIFIPEDFNSINNVVMLAVQIIDGTAVVMYINNPSGPPEPISLWDPTSGYNQETINLIKTVMADKSWYFYGDDGDGVLSTAETQAIDQLVKFKTIDTQLYIKRDNWVIFETTKKEKGKAQINYETSGYVTLTPNVFHVWGEISYLSIGLAPETPGIINEYLFQFTSGESPTSLSFPSNIKWATDPIILPNKVYQISILNGLGSILQFDL